MHKILHRVNTIKELRNTSQEFGVEVDIRSQNQDLIIHHDPFAKGESFTKWLDNFNHGTLILNVKEEGLESRLLDLMSEYGIENFFFLDQSFPFLKKTVSNGENRCSIRISEFENIGNALKLSGLVKWAWIDCFTKFPLSLDESKKLKNAGYNLCFVSPELQGKKDKPYILKFKENIYNTGIEGDAVCTKHPELW